MSTTVSQDHSDLRFWTSEFFLGKRSRSFICEIIWQFHALEDSCSLSLWSPPLSELFHSELIWRFALSAFLRATQSCSESIVEDPWVKQYVLFRMQNSNIVWIIFSEFLRLFEVQTLNVQGCLQGKDFLILESSVIWIYVSYFNTPDFIPIKLKYSINYSSVLN